MWDVLRGTLCQHIPRTTCFGKMSSTKPRERELSQTGDNLTEKLHSSIHPDIDPSSLRLDQPLVVCVVGGSRGIGAEVAKAFATANASIIILAARAGSVPQLRSVENEIKTLRPNIDVRTQPCDVTSASSVSALASWIEQEVGRLDVVVYNSGFSGPVILKVTEGDPADFERTFAVNSIGTHLAAHYLVPLLLQSPNGAKMFLAMSTAAAWLRDGPIANSGYCISKLAQVRLIEHMALQYRDEGLFTAAIHPGAVLTEMADESVPDAFRPCESSISVLRSAF